MIHQPICKGRSTGGNLFGEADVAEMNRLGMIVEVSQISDQAVWDVLASLPHRLKSYIHPTFSQISKIKRIISIDKLLAD